MDAVSRRLFWIASRVAFTVYTRFPIFGTLRSAVGVIRRGADYLAIDRADGRGLGLPGGLARRRESDEQAVRREIAEETGLTVTSAEYLFRCSVSHPIPASIAVFQVTAIGDLRGSWEGEPRWVTLDELRSRATKAQRPIIEQLGRSNP
ncbi:MAG TPA: NUDIX domain-containing protein [Terriglobia bacterium]|nr:NUDIX domain-containing protein [Terriglobia bacterium]